MRRGSTLIELLATLALMALVATVVTLAFRSPGSSQPVSDPYALVAQARTRAVRTRQPVTIELAAGDAANPPRVITALPDGEVLADPSLGIDRLTGERLTGERQ